MTQHPDSHPVQLRLPCAESDTPEDWFISRDGRQYTDDEYLTDQQMEAIAILVVRRWGTGPGLYRRIVDAIVEGEEQAKDAALVRRRHAKDACFVECLFRERCLDRALTEGHEHGTWGGYYEEELRILRKKIARRKNARARQGLAND